jgi:hypothetical protein
MPKDPLQDICFICNSEFRMGGGVYNGHYIRRYQISVCDPCWAGNWDGWAPIHEGRLLAHLKEKGIPIPKRNAGGWLPRE